MKYENKSKTTEEINKQPKWKQFGFKNGMLGKFVWKKQANIKKGKGRKRKIKKPQILMFSKKGADGQKAKG